MVTLVDLNSASSSSSQSRRNDDATATGEQRSKRLNSGDEPEDRIGALPDSVIHRILSFLPTTKDAIRTCILSKRWKHQWTHVPVLHFDSAGLSPITFSALIDRTLARYDCLRMLRFYIKSRFGWSSLDRLHFWIHFAVRREVKELLLGCSDDKFSNWRLPRFLFNNESLILLNTCNWVFWCSGKVNWPSLKSLNICRCGLPDGAIENVISGSPSLESLNVTNCEPSDELKLNQLVISSKSLKTLVLINISEVYCSKLEILCPNLEELELLGDLFFRTFKLLNMPSLIKATLEFVACESGDERVFAESSALEILKQMHCAKELVMGAWFTKVLSDLVVVGRRACRQLQIKHLTFDVYGFQDSVAGIGFLFHISPMLEKLFIELRKDPVSPTPFAGQDLYQKWNSNVLKNLPPNLKKVEIFGIDEKTYQYQRVLGFADSVLRRARVLEKMVIYLNQGCRLDFAFNLSKFLLRIRRCSPYVTVDISWSACSCRN